MGFETEYRRRPVSSQHLSIHGAATGVVAPLDDSERPAEDDLEHDRSRENAGDWTRFIIQR